MYCIYAAELFTFFLRLFIYVFGIERTNLWQLRSEQCPFGLLWTGFQSIRLWSRGFVCFALFRKPYAIHSLSTRLTVHCKSIVQMSFTQLYSSVLAPFIKTFKEAKNDKGRKSVINDAADAVTKAHDLLEDANDLPKDLQTVCVLIFFSLFWTHMYGFRL
jgi:hypothetical protein